MKIVRDYQLVSITLLSTFICSTHGFPVAANSLLGETSYKTPEWLAQQNTPSSRDVSSFFETGRLPEEDRLLFQNPPDGIIPVRETSNSWQFIIVRSAGCSFWMPPGVLTQEKVVLETKVGQLSFRTLAANSESGRYVVGYAESLTEEQVNNPQLLLAAISEKAAPSAEFTLKQKQSVSLDSYPGQELTFQGANELIIIRAYLVGQRVYAIGVRHPEDGPDSRKVRAFLNSLQLLSDS